jgi:hypothetical protein
MEVNVDRALLVKALGFASGSAGPATQGASLVLLEAVGGWFVPILTIGRSDWALDKASHV